MITVVSPSASCRSCGPAEESVCAHLGRSGWTCVYCGAPAASSASFLSVVRATLGLVWDKLVFGLRTGVWLG